MYNKCNELESSWNLPHPNSSPWKKCPLQNPGAEMLETAAIKKKKYQACKEVGNQDPQEWQGRINQLNPNQKWHG